MTQPTQKTPHYDIHYLVWRMYPAGHEGHWEKSDEWIAEEDRQIKEILKRDITSPGGASASVARMDDGEQESGLPGR